MIGSYLFFDSYSWLNLKGVVFTINFIIVLANVSSLRVVLGNGRASRPGYRLST
jgi:hypothetical protein